MTRVEEAKLNVICNIGHLTKLEVCQLNAAAAGGEIEKWRGYWHPVPGANFGIGPLKTCWGPVGAAAKLRVVL